jgi:hypothetical protein
VARNTQNPQAQDKSVSDYLALKAQLAAMEAAKPEIKARAQEVKRAANAKISGLACEGDADSVTIQLDITIPRSTIAGYKRTEDGRGYLMQDIAQNAVEFEFEGRKYVLPTRNIYAVEAKKAK